MELTDMWEEYIYVRAVERRGWQLQRLGQAAPGTSDAPTSSRRATPLLRCEALFDSFVYGGDTHLPSSQARTRLPTRQLRCLLDGSPRKEKECKVLESNEGAEVLGTCLLWMGSSLSADPRVQLQRSSALRHVCVPLHPFSAYVLKTGSLPFHE